jgi:nucleoside-diphosphate-sugar epimerase
MVISNDKKIAFVTGATGKIGRYLIPRLLSDGFSVKVLVRKKEHPWPESEHLQIFEGDIADEGLIKKAIQGCDYIFHLAVYQNNNDTSMDKFRRVNVEGTKTLLGACLGGSVKNIVYLSTAMVFKPTGKEQKGEEWAQKPVCPEDLYVQTKIEALSYARRIKKQLPIIIVYPTAVIDLKDFSSTRPVMEGLQKFLWEKVGGGIPGGLLCLIGPKDRVFNYVIVEDLVDGIILAALKGIPGEEYILGGENISVEKYLLSAGKRLNKKIFPFRIPCFPFQIAHMCRHIMPIPKLVSLIAKNERVDMCFSSEKAKKTLGYVPNLRIGSS